MIFSTFAAAAAAAATMPPPGNCIDALCDYRVLAPYFEKLERAQGRGGRGVHILQIGDSHTAGDAITGAWRDILQARYGGGGRGVLPPGRPYDGYLPHGVNVAVSPGWRVSATFGPASADPRPALGLSGFSLTSTRDGASMALTANPEQRFNRLVVCALTRPDAGTLTIHVGATTTHMRLDSGSARAECRTVTVDQAVTTADVTAEGGPVTITSWASFRDEGGVVLSNLGVVGSQLVHFARTDDGVLAEELRAYQPDLIVIAFGTNEGFAPSFSAFSYEVTVRTQIGRLRRLAGNVPILMLGAPDASSRRPEMLLNAPGQSPAPCAEPVAAAAASAPPSAPPNPDRLAGIMADLRASQGIAADPAPSAPVAQPAPAQNWAVTAKPLFPPAALKAVRDVQRRIAASLGVAFWDWEARMGGRCAAVKWVKGAPPLMRGDYVHFNSAGGREIGSRLQIDLDRAAGALGQR